MCDGERRSVSKSSQELDDYDLADYSAAQDSHKDVVVKYALEDIYLLHLTRAYLIEDLKKEIEPIPFQTLV